MSVEPSMEEILSSIKRIIAEEGDGPARGRRLSRPAPEPRNDEAREEETEVLELSDPIPDPVRSDPEPVFSAAPEPRPEPEPAQVETPERFAAREQVARAEPAATPLPKAPPAAQEPIVSASTAEASRGSLESLSRLLVKPDPASDGTLEGLVRDMLRPMLREWLDARLPVLVETMVADEIARITGQPR